MPGLDPISSARFDAIRSAHLELERINLQELRKFARAGDRDKVARLKHARAELSRCAGLILDAQQAYQATHLAPGAAELCLREHTAQAETLVRRIGTLTDVIESAARISRVLTRLVSRLA